MDTFFVGDSESNNLGVSSFVVGVSVDAMSWVSMKFGRLSIVHLSQRWAKSEFDLISWLYFSVDTNIKHFTWVQLLQRPHDMALLFAVMFFFSHHMHGNLGLSVYVSGPMFS